MTITNFGKMLRKIRIDRGELLYDMAKKLGVTSSYLSAVELGKRKVPDGWVENLIKEYNLPLSEQKKLYQYAYENKNNIKIDVEQCEEERKDLALAFASRFRSLNQEKRQAIMEILKRHQK